MVSKSQPWQNAQTAVPCTGTTMYAQNAVTIVAGRY